jgi:hypothetical protein
VVLIHAAYGAAAADIAVDEGPNQPPTRFAIDDSYDAAAERNWAANASHAAAAASIGPDPGPTYIRPELTSGGKPPKSIATPRN